MATHKKKYCGLVIAGTHSSVGKSSISAGLMRLLTRKGFSVKPFKVGPDYIDPGHHERACGRPSYNLDSYMCSPQYIKSLFDDVVSGGDIAIAEGVMGLFDGAYPKKETGSTAEIAKLLGLPVILVIDGRAMARSAAALVEGFLKFDRKLKFLGVIANRVSSERHQKLIRDAIGHYSKVKLLGCLPVVKGLEIPSRHLGLVMSHEQKESLYEGWADHIENHINVKHILGYLKKTVSKWTSVKTKGNDRWRKRPSACFFTVAVARDEAFRFCYQDTLDMFEHFGGSVKFFSPVGDSRLPPGTDWVYIPGGYPELHARALSSNRSMISELRGFADAGKVIVAECGGLMHLGKSIIDESGSKHDMAGLFDFSTTVENKKMTLGYRKFRFTAKSSPRKSMVLKGHEFHFSSFTDNRETATMVHKPGGNRLTLKDGYRYKNCYALYSHIYWGSSPDWLKFILSKAGCGRSLAEVKK
ncbi:MAG: cobyrinate a,c-diamide synthase [Nitrospinaceae bacterium]